MATVFGAVDFLDTFMHYPIPQTTVYGKWTAGAGVGSPITISEDGFQGLSGGFSSKVLPSSPVGRIVGTRWAGVAASGTSSVFCLRTIADVAVCSMQYMEFTGQLRLTFFVTGGPTITTTLLNIPNGNLNNIDFAILFNAGVCNYRTRLNSNTIVTELTGSFATADVPAMAMLQVGIGTSIAGVSQRCWIYTKPWSSGAWVDADVDAAFLGNVNRGVQYVSADGADTIAANWDPSDAGAAPTFDLLNEVLADPANYVFTTVDPNSAPTAAHKISYQTQNTPATLTAVKAVQRCDLIWMQTGAGEVRLGSRVDGVGAGTFDATFFPPATPTFKLTPYGLDPRDGLGWDKTKLDNLEVITQTWNLT